MTPERSLTMRSTEPLVAVFVEEDGEEAVRYFAGDVPAEPAQTDDAIADALSLAGAWSDLDWQEIVEELDRIRHASPPTPPIESGRCGSPGAGAPADT